MCGGGGYVGVCMCVCVHVLVCVHVRMCVHLQYNRIIIQHKVHRGWLIKLIKITICTK